MSITYNLPQFPNHFMAPMPSYLDSPPQQYIPPASASSAFMDSFYRPEFRHPTPHSPTPLSPSSAGNGHRVSKAKKGKRVHACEYPGCNKIFTRAEHQRRHETSHKNKKSYSCTYVGCHKSFHRADYLAQHLRRHSSGGHHSPKIKTPSVIKTEPASYSPSTPPMSQSYSTKSGIAPASQSVENNSAGASRTLEPQVPCSQCFNCQNSQLCEDQSAYINSYINGMDHSPESSVSSASGLLATHSSHPSFVQPGIDSVIEQYMRSILRPEAFITPPQSLSPPLQAQEPMDSSFWDSNIDPNLPSLNPGVFNNPAPYSEWSTANDNLSPSVQTHRTGSSPDHKASS
ncbi:uncharacterized protein N7482_006957 [Penicillium canariense]|uniref:C2H2 type master regulator of conidiophore development brlA n=1 Tax=Penicillium canariense TaxID=189055 RepID=A0A9W9HW00_9EURO|nr:uncharacterized protein N7482_006957 [Penicillium canariense]KAJ5159953.1 hypothetical protein N7482_006957 [Penicillium canariense]